MRVILRRTLEDTLKIVSIILTIAGGIAGGYILAKAGHMNSVPLYNSYLNACTIRQHLATFFLTNGAVLMSLVSSVSSGLIAGEVHEGTFRILVSKPTSRMKILLAKLLGMWIGVVILMVLGLCSLFMAEMIFGNFDGNIYAGLISYFPNYFLYGMIVTFFFSSLATLLSCIMKKRIWALLPMLFIIIVVLALPVIIRVVSSLAGSQFAGLPPYLDLNYHFGQLFRWCCELKGPITVSSGQLSSMTILMNLFTANPVDFDLTRGMEYGSRMVANNVIQPNLVLMIYLIISALGYLASFLIIRRKDV